MASFISTPSPELLSKSVRALTVDERSRALIWLVAIVAVAFGLRAVVLTQSGGLGSLSIQSLARESYWWDEGYSVRFAQMRLGDMLRAIHAEDVNPPLYYVLLHYWVKLWGPGEVATRMLSVLVGALSIVAFYRVGALLFGRRVGILAAAALALSVFHVRYSQEARAYSLLTLLGLVSMESFVTLLVTPSRKVRLAYVASTCLMLYAHAGGIFVLVAQNAYVLATALRGTHVASSLTRWMALQGVVVSLLLPWVWFMWDSPATHGEWITAQSLATIPATLKLYAGSWPALLVLGCLALTGWLLLTSAEARRELARARAGARVEIDRPLLLGLWLLAPIPLSMLYSLLTHRPLFVARYGIVSSCSLFLLAAYALESLPWPRVRRGLLALSLVVLLAAVYRHDTLDRKQPWRQTVQLIEATARSGDLVLVSDGPGLRNMVGHYLTRTDLARAAVVEDSRAALPTAIPAALEATTRGFGRVWFVASYPRLPATLATQVALERRFGAGRSLTLDAAKDPELHFFQRP